MMDNQREQCLRQAIAMEEEGKAFYLNAASSSSNQFAKNVFEALAKEEDYHIAKIGEVYRRVREGGSLSEWITCIAAGAPHEIFEKTLLMNAASSKGDIDALRLGLEIEEKSIKYYQDLADEATDRYEKRFYLALTQEERGHYLKIMDSIEYLSDPEGWHYVHQRSMVDGG